MREFESFTDEVRAAAIQRGRDWFADHTSHVERILKNERNAIAPSGSDLFRPELWTSIHWKWFMDNYR